MGVTGVKKLPGVGTIIRAPGNQDIYEQHLIAVTEQSSTKVEKEGLRYTIQIAEG